MTRAAWALLLLVAAPGASAWVPCSDPGLEAPLPLEREPPAYPEAVRATGIEGSVEIALTVLRDGRTGWVRVLRATPDGYFEQAAAEGVRRWRFTPARQDGEPVECRMLTRVRFALTDEVTTAAGAAVDGRPRPVYPPALLKDRIEGYVEVEYSLDSAGNVQDARVTGAMPRGGFEQAALAAVRAWKGPASVDARPRETRRFAFRLPDSMLGEVPATMLGSAPFPAAACAQGAAGRVVLEVDTLATGEVRAARILAAEPAGLFDSAALAIARGSRLSPAYRDAVPIPATALLTLRFDPERANCPGSQQQDRSRPPSRRPPPKVTRHGESTLPRAEA
jgi:TonB family protein